jgi:hypothetical protein
MILAIHAQALATIKITVHLTAALAIMWCFYRVANGHFSLL